jgi:hypothetical protein
MHGLSSTVQHRNGIAADQPEIRDVLVVHTDAAPPYLLLIWPLYEYAELIRRVALAHFASNGADEAVQGHHLL